VVFPQYYFGQIFEAQHQPGNDEWKMNGWIKAIVESIRAVKANQTSLQLQNEFLEKAQHPLGTKQ
jgi:creatinine amidohydrolase